MFSFNEYENTLYGIHISLSIDEEWGNHNLGKMIQEPEIDKLLEMKPKHNWRIAPNAAKYQNLLFNIDSARIVFKNTIYQVAYLGNVHPPKEVGRPESGYKFAVKKAIYHSHPSTELYAGTNPKDPSLNDTISLVWWFQSGVIVFDLWKHSEYDEKLAKWRRK
ncbi:hypothetical protein VPFG_00038 [Vibrio phage nt-1]|uniref:JAB domain-containing protein n=1 Tax=Vibrio phage nt-1 TaxID=115992 RepID=R9TG27_9CAUD|nr:hypothetical protein VPFG_00038 [Vibrio phage nt-1]AGN30043.1 hypothetical protein VPFG_00038 [Vibrio phage nt-1]